MSKRKPPSEWSEIEIEMWLERRESVIDDGEGYTDWMYEVPNDR